MKKLILMFSFLAAVGLAAFAARQPGAAQLAGFTATSAKAHLEAERRFMAMPSAERMRQDHLYLTDKPHVAGSARNRDLAVWTRDEFLKYGLEDVQMVLHEVLLPWPEEVSVEMTRPRAWKASMREDPIEGDHYSQAPVEELGIPYHAYSASGEVTAPVVYAGSGNPSDYEALAKRGIDIKGQIALVRYSVPYSYRGFKALTAERLGAAGILIYSDIEDSGSLKGTVYPEGPWGPDSTIQRGGIVYDFMVPGDPLTPGWASVPGAKRIDRADAVSLPKIISAPLSFKDARVILEAMGSPHRNKESWQAPAELPVVRMKVTLDDEVREIQTVTGMIRGSERPEELVILGNHRDAWVYGGVDPSSGSAAMMELARNLGELVKSGWRPKRSILFASWDAEEFTLTSSTEWGEQFEDRLKRSAVAYLNVDSAASGPHFSAAAVPALNALIEEVAAAVADPREKKPIGAVSRERSTAERGSLSSADAGPSLVNNRLGSGSDYTVFLNFLGVPVADLSFDGPYGVYHSMYDNHHWVAKVGDPGFRYHVSMVQIWGLLAMRLANADIVPLDYEPYARTIAGFVEDVSTRGASVAGLTEVRRAVQEMRNAAEAFNERRGAALRDRDAKAIADLNARLLRVERALLDPDGIPGRPWYRHQIYAPKYTYAPELLPGVAEALDAGDSARVEAQARVLAAALRRAAGMLDVTSGK